MKMKGKLIKKTAQEMQDDIFRKMTEDRKIEIGSQLWQLAKELAGDKIHYGINRSQAFIDKNRQNS